LVGTLVAGYIDPNILKVILGVGLFAVALSFFRAPKDHTVVHLDNRIEEEYGGKNAETCLVTSNGETICYTVCNKNEGRFIIGAQLGSRVAHRISQDNLERGLGVLFVLVAALTLFEAAI
jgi:uncharacterized membrane protein YfcA